MDLDKDKMSNFVGVLISTLRAEIGESAARAERLGEAVKHTAAARDRAQKALDNSAARRDSREERLWRFDDNGFS